MRSVCQNCGRRFNALAKLAPIKGIFERVAPGEIMPAGECPDCGSLCTPQLPPILIKVTHRANYGAEFQFVDCHDSEFIVLDHEFLKTADRLCLEQKRVSLVAELDRHEFGLSQKKVLHAYIKKIEQAIKRRTDEGR